MLKVLFGIFLFRFGDMGDVGTDDDAAAATDEVATSKVYSLCFGVGDRGGACSDEGNKFDDVWVSVPDLFGGGGDSGIGGLPPVGIGLPVRSRDDISELVGVK